MRTHFNKIYLAGIFQKLIDASMNATVPFALIIIVLHISFLPIIVRIIRLIMNGLRGDFQKNQLFVYIIKTMYIKLI